MDGRRLIQIPNFLNFIKTGDKNVIGKKMPCKQITTEQQIFVDGEFLRI